MTTVTRFGAVRSGGPAPESVIAALDAMAAVLGADAVERGSERVAAFRDPYRAAGHVVHEPAGVVYPTSTEQVQEVVRIAGHHGMPLQTSAQGRNFGYGGAEPRTGGVIALSLRRMDRILEIDADLGFAVVEPGVSFAALHEAVVASGAKLLVSAPDLSWGSVIGNALDHGIGYTPRGEHNDNLVGLDVVLADGSVLRTGTGGMPGTPNRYVHKRGFGPGLDGLFAQSNFGIVTRAGVWLLPEPPCFARISVTVGRHADLAALVDTARPLMMDGTIRGYPSIVQGFMDVAARLPRERWGHLDGFGTEEQLAPLLDELGAAPWTLRASLYGREDVVDSDLAMVESAFCTIPGARFDAARYHAPYTRDTVAPPHHNGAGLPGLGFLAAYDPWGGRDRAGHIDFSPVSPLRGEDAMVVQNVLAAGFARHRTPALGAVICRPRSIVHVNMLMYALEDTAAVDASRSAWTDLHGELAGLGYGVYRAHGDFADDVLAAYDPTVRSTYDRIKDALDPAGILSPGSHGIWGTAP